MNNSIVIFCYSTDNTTESVDVRIRNQEQNIKKGFSDSRVEKSFFVKQQSDLLTKFKEAVTFTKDQKSMLVIGSFAPFQRNLYCFQLLASHKIQFQFIDLPSLCKGKVLTFLVEYLSFTKKIKGDKISAKIKERQNQGKKQGLEHLKKKDLNQVITMANYAKRFKSATNPATAKARKLIIHLRDNENQSYRKIAAYLNEHNITTVRGNKFGPKSVERLYIVQTRSQNRTKPNDEFNIIAAPMMNGNQQSFEFENFKRKKGFKDEMKLTFKKKPSGNTTLYIFSNNGSKDEKPLYSMEIPKSKKEIIIPLKKIGTLLPGLFYLKLVNSLKSTEDFVRDFYFYKEALILNEL